MKPTTAKETPANVKETAKTSSPPKDAHITSRTGKIGIRSYTTVWLVIMACFGTPYPWFIAKPLAAISEVDATRMILILIMPFVFFVDCFAKKNGIKP